MLVCNVSLRPPRGAIAADIIEAVDATDEATTGNVVFATLVDDPASVNETVDAYLGEIMLEAASASDSVGSGFAYDAVITEAAAAASVEDGSTTAAPTFTTFNPADRSGITLSNGNLTATSTAGTSGVRSINSHSAGKYYWEYTYTTINTNGLNVGAAVASYVLSSGGGVGAAMVTRLGGNIIINNSSTGSTLGTINPSNVIGVAIDVTASLIWLRVAPSGNWNGSGTANPATATGGLSVSALSGALYALFIGGTGDVCTANFGASSFTGAVPSGFNSGF